MLSPDQTTIYVAKVTDIFNTYVEFFFTSHDTQPFAEGIDENGNRTEITVEIHLVDSDEVRVAAINSEICLQNSSEFITLNDYRYDEGIQIVKISSHHNSKINKRKTSTQEFINKLSNTYLDMENLEDEYMGDNYSILPIPKLTRS
jgi:hypothetical protein